MKLNSLEDLFKDQLMDMHSSEQQLASALPKMVEKASSKEVREALASHLDITRKQLERLDRIGSQMGMDLKGKTCEAMQGLIKEGETILAEGGSGEALDAAIIAAAQKIEHYEIASYGSVCTYAQELGHKDALELLKQTLDEEEKTDQQLTRIAEDGVNQRAVRA